MHQTRKNINYKKLCFSRSSVRQFKNFHLNFVDDTQLIKYCFFNFVFQHDSWKNLHCFFYNDEVVLFSGRKHKFICQGYSSKNFWLLALWNELWKVEFNGTNMDLFASLILYFQIHIFLHFIWIKFRRWIKNIINQQLAM